MSVEDIIKSRQRALKDLHEAGWNYPNDFRRDALASALHDGYGAASADDLTAAAVSVRIAGRVMSRRVMGKAAFLHVQDMSGRMQVYLKKEELPDGVYDAARKFDLGDIIGIGGDLFRTRAGELSIRAVEVHLLSKSLLPLPEKFHGLTDREERYRRRYLDLIANEDSRRVFTVRAEVIRSLRSFLHAQGFMEVETPMMQVLPGGAVARPFVTHHNSLDMDLYLRVAPELYLKRLLIGGMEKVFELNRCFRNEGLSVRHNPEFTLLEFYQAYIDYQDMMRLVEDMLRELVQTVAGETKPQNEAGVPDLSVPFRRLGLRAAVLEHNPTIKEEDLNDADKLRGIIDHLNIPVAPSAGPGAMECALFEKTVEAELIQPTFITDYPAEVSPLARRHSDRPHLTERFECFIGGREVANGFSELNDPAEQAGRFKEQDRQRAGGDEEAMRYDEEFITAMEYGMPPAAGAGIGVDRLVMILTGSPSIRDVVLFPHLRPRSDR